MRFTSDYESSSKQLLLQEMENKFNAALNNGEAFDKVKKIFLEIKQLKQELNQRSDHLYSIGIGDRASIA